MQSGGSITQEDPPAETVIADIESNVESSTVETEADLAAAQEEGRVDELESEIVKLEAQLASVDDNIEKLLKTVETLRPIYAKAKEKICEANCTHQQRNSLVFHGIKPDKLEVSLLLLFSHIEPVEWQKFGV